MESIFDHKQKRTLMLFTSRHLLQSSTQPPFPLPIRHTLPSSVLFSSLTFEIERMVQALLPPFLMSLYYPCQVSRPSPRLDSSKNSRSSACE
ncbi:hypothetical protein ACTXT7_008623 [Hymenolepis weldensis]